MIRILIISTFLLSSYTWADVQCPKGTRFKESLTITADNGENITTKLNGVGLKKVAFLSVFYGALYLEQTSKNAVNILNSNQLKIGVIHTLMSVSKKRMVKIWNDEFNRLCDNLCDQLRPYHQKFISYARNFKKNETLYLIIFDDHFEFEVNGNEVYPPIYSADYGMILQRVLLGPDAEDKKLENGLLGKEVICKKV